LRAAGHDVYAVTLTGLGERAHLASPAVDLNTHIRDVTALIDYEELESVVLVGHSYGGLVITGVAAELPSRIARLIYVDANAAGPGESMVDSLAPGVAQYLRDHPEIEMSTPPRVDDETMAWWRSKMTPQPIRTMTAPVPAGDPASAAIPKTFIACTASDITPRVEAVRADPTWRVLDIDTDHFPMVRAPERLAELLMLPDPRAGNR
jgi:pimeloyl-ACP methyl ester carboxylesterase